MCCKDWPRTPYTAAMQVHDLIRQLGLDLTEDEFSRLIGVCASGGDVDHATNVLRAMSQELTELQEGTLAAVSSYFR